jgi:hypothetical protein
VTVVVAPRASFTAIADGFASGLVGLIGVQIIDPATSTVIQARTTTGVTETVAGSGVYSKTLAAPTTPGTYLVYWDNGAAGDSNIHGDEPLIVNPNAGQIGALSGGDTVTMFVGATEPPLLRTMKNAGKPIDLDAAGFTSVGFSLRPAASSTPVIDEATAVIVDAVNGVVRYDWQDADTDTPGDYFAWWTLVTAAGTQDTSEFLVRIVEHKPTSTGISTSELAQSLRLSGRAKIITGDEEELLEQLLVRATRRVEQYIGHRFDQETATTKTFSYHGEGMLDLAPWDLRGTPSLVTLDTDIGPGVVLDQWGWRLEPRTAPHGFYTHLMIAYGAPGRYASSWWSEDRPIAGILGRQVSITGNWGWPSIPEDLRGAIIEIAQAMFQNPPAKPSRTAAARPLAGSSPAPSAAPKSSPRACSRS